MGSGGVMLYRLRGRDAAMHRTAALLASSQANTCSRNVRSWNGSSVSAVAAPFTERRPLGKLELHSSVLRSPVLQCPVLPHPVLRSAAVGARRPLAAVQGSAVCCA